MNTPAAPHSRTRTTPLCLASAGALLALSACSGEAPRTPYEARQQIEEIGAKVSSTKERVDVIADKTVEGAKVVGAEASAAAGRATELAAPAIAATKEGLTSLGDFVLGLGKAAGTPREPGEPAKVVPPPEDVTQPARF
jgi:hypothetical protein